MSETVGESEQEAKANELLFVFLKSYTEGVDNYPQEARRSYAVAIAQTVYNVAVSCDVPKGTIELFAEKAVEKWKEIK